MSALGRQSARIDLNRATMQSILDLNERVESVESSVSTFNENQIGILANLGVKSSEATYNEDGLEISPSIEATGLNLKVELNEESIQTINTIIGTKQTEDTLATGLFLDIETNESNILLNTTAIHSINDTIGSKSTEDEPATGIFLDIDTNKTYIDTINNTIGNDTLDPKTGIFLKLQNLTEGHEIIPNYNYLGEYIILLDLTLSTDDTEKANIVINNTENKHLNDILLEMHKKIIILEKNNELTRDMLTQSGYGVGSTVIKSGILTPILFNTRNLEALGLGISEVPSYELLEDTSTETVQLFSIELTNWIANIIPEPIFDAFLLLSGKTREEFIQDFIKAQDPQTFVESEFFSKVKIGIDGDLYVKPSGSLYISGITELGYSFLNASEIITKANGLANIQTIGTGLSLSVLHELSLTFPILGLGDSIAHLSIEDATHNNAIQYDHTNKTIHVHTDETTLTVDASTNHIRISTSYLEARQAEITEIDAQIQGIYDVLGLQVAEEGAESFWNYITGGGAILAGILGIGAVSGGAITLVNALDKVNDKIEAIEYIKDLLQKGTTYQNNAYFINSGNIGIGYERTENITEKLTVNGNVICDNIKSTAFISPDGTELYLKNADKRILDEAEGELTTQISLIDDYYTKSEINTNFALKSQINTFDKSYNSLTDKPDFTNNFIFGEPFPYTEAQGELGELFQATPFFRFQISGDGVAGRGNIRNNAMVIRSDTTPYIMALNNNPTGDSILNLQVNFDNFITPTDTTPEQNAVGAQLGYRKGDGSPLDDFSGFFIRNLSSEYEIDEYGNYRRPLSSDWTMVLTDDKNVGIGTIYPSEKLEVNGNIKCDNIYTNTLTDDLGVEIYLGAIPDDGNPNGLTRRSFNDYALKSELNTSFYTKTQIDDKNYLTEHQSLAHIYTKSEIDDKNYLTSHQSLDNYYTKTDIDSRAYLTAIPSEYITDAELTSKGYLTSHQSLESYALKTEINTYGDANVNTLLDTKNYLTDSALNNLVNKDVLFQNQITEPKHFNINENYNYDGYDATNTPEIGPNIYYDGEDRDGYINLNTYQQNLIYKYYQNDTLRFQNVSQNGITKIIYPDTTEYTLNPTNPSILTFDQLGLYSYKVITNDVYGNPRTYLYPNMFNVEIGYELSSTIKPIFLYGDANVNALLDTKGYLTSHQSLDAYALKSELNTSFYTKTQIDDKNYLTEHQSLAHIYTKSEIDDKNYLTSHQSLDNYYTKTDIDSRAYLTAIPSEYITDAELTSKGYLTSHQSLDAYALKTELENINLSSYYNKSEVDNLLENIDIPTTLPSDLLSSSSGILTFTINDNNYISGTQRNYSDDSIINIAQPGWVSGVYITGTARISFGSYYNQTFTSTQPNNILYAFEGDTITIIDQVDRLTTWESETTYCYLTLFYIKKNENVSYDILRRDADISTGYAGKVGTYVIEGSSLYSQYSNIKTTITYTLPSSIDSAYEFRFGFGKINDLNNQYSDFRMCRIESKSNTILNNNYIKELPIENIKFPIQTGFLKITDGNLSYTEPTGDTSDPIDLSDYIKKNELYDGVFIKNTLLDIYDNGYIKSTLINPNDMGISSFTSIEQDILNHINNNGYLNISDLNGGNNITITSALGGGIDINCTLQNTDTIYTGTTNQIVINENNEISISPNFTTGETYTAGTNITITDNVINCDVINTDTIYTGTTNQIVINENNEISISPNYQSISYQQIPTMLGTYNIEDTLQYIGSSDYTYYNDFRYIVVNTEGYQSIIQISLKILDQEQQFTFNVGSKTIVSLLLIDSVKYNNYKNITLEVGLYTITLNENNVNVSKDNVVLFTSDNITVPLEGFQNDIIPDTSESQNNNLYLNNPKFILRYNKLYTPVDLRLNDNEYYTKTEIDNLNLQNNPTDRLHLENTNYATYINFTNFNDEAKTILKDNASIYLSELTTDFVIDRSPLSENIETHGISLAFNGNSKLRVLNSSISCFVPLKVNKIIFSDNTELITAQTGNIEAPQYATLSTSSTSTLRNQTSTSQSFETNNYIQFNDELEINDSIIFDGAKFKSYQELLQTFQNKGLIYNSLYFDGGGLAVSYPISTSIAFKKDHWYYTDDSKQRLYFETDSTTAINSETQIDLKTALNTKLSIKTDEIVANIPLKVSKIIFNDNTELTSAPSGGGGGSVSYPLNGTDIFNVNEYYKTTDGDFRLLFMSSGASIINSSSDIDFRIANSSKLSVHNSSITSQVNINTPSITFSDGSQITTAPSSGFSGDYNDLQNIPTSTSFSGDYNDLQNIPSVNPLNSSSIFKYGENITSTDGQNRFYFYQNNATQINSPISMQFRVDNSLKLNIRNNAYMDCLTTGVSTTGGTNKSFWSTSANALYPNNTYAFPISFSTSQGIWVRSYYFVSSSDRRIKKDIYELNDRECLDKLMLLKPCKYKHKDSISRGDRETYGFIAQEVEEVIPEAVKTKDHFIPNIYKIGKYNDHVITLNETTEYTPVQGDIIMIYDEDDVLTETTILEVYSDVSFKIEDEILTENVFIYGSKIDDFKTLIKEMFHPICVSSIQEHNKIINEQQEKINYLEEKLNMIMNHLNLT